MTTERPHLSQTQIEMFSKCPEQFRRRYIEGHKLPPGVAMLQGLVFHRPAERNFRQKIETRKDLPISDFKEMAAAEFEIQAAGDVAFSEEDISRGTKVVLGEAKDATVAMAAFHAVHQAPDYQPVLVEKRIRIELPMLSHDLLAILDLADDQDRVIDLKTSGKAKSQADADTSIQLTTYDVAYRAETGRSPSELRLDTVVRTKTKISRDVKVTRRDSGDTSALANRINVVLKSIQAGVFPATSPGAWWCSSKFCGYWNTCPYQNSERRAAAEANE